MDLKCNTLKIPTLREALIPQFNNIGWNNDFHNATDTTITSIKIAVQ